MICIYVDDFLWAGTLEFRSKLTDQLEHIFLIESSKSKSELKGGSFTLDQLDYASTLNPMTVSCKRANVK